MRSRSRERVVAILFLAGIAACTTDPAPTPSSTTALPSSTTVVIETASTYDPSNVGSVSALTEFLTAEVDGDFEASFELLSSVDQGTTAGADGWTAEHYLVVPTILDFQLVADSSEGTRAEVSVNLTLEAGLDQMVGLRPAHADSTWVLLEEVGEWRVVFTESRIEPVYLDEATAPRAVEQWAAHRQNCEPATEWDTSLLGFPSLAESLCGSTGAIRIGDPVRLTDAADASSFLAAFGPEVGIWARVVPVDGEFPLRAVVAPIGEEWVVIGVLAI